MLWDYKIQQEQEEVEEYNDDADKRREEEPEEVQTEVAQEVNKLFEIHTPEVYSLNTSFTDMLEIPEMSKMVGFDQRTPHHLLTLDEHSGEAWLNGVRNTWLSMRPYRPYVLLALGMHDVGKSVCYQEEQTPTGVRRHFQGHEHYSQQIIEEILLRDFRISKELVLFVKQLAGLSTNGLLKAYDAYLRHELTQEEFRERVQESHVKIKEQAVALQWDCSPQEKIQLAFVFNYADKQAAYSSEKNYTSPEEIALIAHRKKQGEFLLSNSRYLSERI